MNYLRLCLRAAVIAAMSSGTQAGTIEATAEKVGDMCTERGWPRDSAQCMALFDESGRILCEESKSLRDLYPEGECIERVSILLRGRAKASM